MIYDIVYDPNTILHKKTAEVNATDIKSKEMQKLFKDMVETMYIKNGVGLAATQINKSIAVCTIVKQFNTYSPHDDLVLINPSWTKLSRYQEWDEEGCLSVPGMFGKIKRYIDIKVKALDKNGKKIEFIARDFFARIVQHEVAHLNGHLYIEYAKDLHAVEKRAKPDSKYPRD